MVKLEGYSRVAVIKYGCTPYYFALYDDGVDYKVGDYINLEINVHIIRNLIRITFLL